jgi:WD40 repeat protein
MRAWTTAEQRLVQSSQAERRKRRQRRRFWQGMGLLAVALILLSAAGMLWQWRLAERRLSETQSMALAAYAGQAQSNGNADLAIAAAYGANTVAVPHPQARTTLAQVAYYRPGTRQLFAGHGAAVTGVAFSPAGDTVLSASADHSVILWQVGAREDPLLQRFEKHGAAVMSVAYDPTDGNRFVSGGKDGNAIVWEISSGETRLFTHAGAVNSVAFHPDGSRILAGTEDGLVVLWHIASGQALWEHRSTMAFNSVAFSPDGTLAVAGTHHGGTDADTVYIWDVATGEQIHRVPQAATYGVKSVAVSPDNRFILAGAGGYGPAFYLLALESGTIARTLQGHSGGDVRVAFDPAHLQYAATGAYDDQIILWDIQNGREMQRFRGHSGRITGLAFSPDGRHLLSGSTDRTVRLWDIANGAERARYEGAWSAASSIACSRDGDTVAASYMDGQGTVYVWQTLPPTLQTFALGRRAADIDLDGDGRWLLAGLAQGTDNLVLWDLNENSERLRFSQEGWITGVAFSPVDGDMALASSFGNSNQPGFPRQTTLALWQVTTGAKRQDLSRHTHTVQDVVFSPDGRRALSGSADTTAILWDLEKGVPLHTLVSHDEDVNSVAFVPPAGRLALTGSADKTVILWDTEAGTIEHRFDGLEGRILTVAASQDGLRAAAGSEAGEIVVWDLATQAEIARIVGHSGAVNKLVFCGDSRTLLSAGSDTTVRLWAIEPPADIVAWTQKNRYVRELTPEERKLVGIE